MPSERCNSGGAGFLRVIDKGVLHAMQEASELIGDGVGSRHSTLILAPDRRLNVEVAPPVKPPPRNHHMIVQVREPVHRLEHRSQLVVELNSGQRAECLSRSQTAERRQHGSSCRTYIRIHANLEGGITEH